MKKEHVGRCHQAAMACEGKWLQQSHEKKRKKMQPQQTRGIEAMCLEAGIVTVLLGCFQIAQHC